MNNIREILLLHKNDNKKIIKISAICSKGDKHMIYGGTCLPENKYNYGICRNCRSVMFNSCKGNKYCTLCINLDEKQIVCKNGCVRIITSIDLRICHKCDRIYVALYHGNYRIPHHIIGDYFIDSNDIVYCVKCWSNSK